MMINKIETNIVMSLNTGFQNELYNKLKQIQETHIQMGQGCTGKPKAIIGSQYNIQEVAHPDEAVHFRKGKQYEHKGDYTSAINSFKQALKVNPNSAPSLNGMGNCSLKKGNTNQAIQYFNQALVADPNYKFAYNGLGVAYENIKDQQNAINAFNKAISIDNNFSYPYNGLGNLYYFRQRFNEALPYYENALKIEPQNPLMHANVACCQAMMGNYEPSINNFIEAKNLTKTSQSQLSPTTRHYLSMKLMEYQQAIMVAPTQIRNRFLATMNSGSTGVQPTAMGKVMPTIKSIY